MRFAPTCRLRFNQFCSTHRLYLSSFLCRGTAFLLLGYIPAIRVHVAACAVAVMVPQPASHVRTRASLVAAFGYQVQKHIRPQYLFVAATVTGVGVEYFSVIILVEHTDAGQLLD